LTHYIEVRKSQTPLVSRLYYHNTMWSSQYKCQYKASKISKTLQVHSAVGIAVSQNIVP